VSWHKGLHQASDTLIKRGTAMGPLAFTLLLVPVLLIIAAWTSSSSPILSAASFVTAIGLLIEYLRKFDYFAKNDPDRLQSEEYRYGIKQLQMIAAKELPREMPAEVLQLTHAVPNPTQPTPQIPGENGKPVAEEAEIV
jgi:hypothetical protein